MRMTDRIDAEVHETHITPFSVSMLVGGHRLSGDEPEAKGGHNLAPSPYDYLLAALGECTAMTVRWYARQKDWPLEDVRVSLSYDRQVGHASGKADVYSKTVTIIGDKLTEDQTQKLIEVAAKCPVHKTLTAGVHIDTVAG